MTVKPPTLAYTVRCTFRDPAVAREWIEWLEDEHIAQVLAAGATGAEVVQLDGEPSRVEVRYHFTSRRDFERYEREHAPRLRALGLARFPLDRGLSYERSLGQIVARRTIGGSGQPGSA